MENLKISADAYWQNPGTFVPVPPPSIIPSSSMFPIAALPSRPPLLSSMSSSILSGAAAQEVMRPVTLIPWGPLANNGKGSVSGKLHPLRKVKPWRDLMAKAQDETGPDFDYGVKFLRPKKIPKPMSLKKHRIVEGYNPDGSLRYAVPSTQPSNESLPMTLNNFYPPFKHFTSLGSPEFTLFGKLPLEIRLKIWKMSLPSDRVIKITRIDYHAADYKKEYHQDGRIRGPLEIDTHYPGMLGACTESRKIALQVYKLAFASPLEGRPVYIDFTRDILFFQDTETLEIFSGYPLTPDQEVKRLHGDLTAVQKIIVEMEVTKNTIKLLGFYDSLKSVTFMEQVLETSFGDTRLRDREAMAMADLWNKKKDGGVGKAGCRCSFEDEELLENISENLLWRKGMLD